MLSAVCGILLAMDKYTYTFRNTPGDMWRYYMSNTYHSLTGIVNIIFTAAVIVLMISRWNTSGVVARVIMVILLLIFPFFQPVAVYGRGVRETEGSKPETTVTFSSSGMKIQVMQHVQNIPWKKMNTFVKRPSFIMIFPDDKHGYLLTNRILGDEKEEFYAFLKEHLSEGK